MQVDMSRHFTMGELVRFALPTIGMMLLMGFNMYGSALFTALGNGLVSAIISFVRTLVFEIGAVFLLPLVLGADGIWYSVSVAELAALVMTAAFAWLLAPTYGYIVRKR